MCLNNFLSILCFILAFSFRYVSAQKCVDRESMYFKPNGTYDKNRRLVLSTLATNVSSRDGYYTYTVGEEGSERLYALGLCSPKTDPKVCSDCIQKTSVGLLNNCPNQIDAYHWRADKTLCYVRYSNHSFFNEMETQMNTADSNNGTITQNLTEFTSVWDDFVTDMIGKASSSTPGSTSGRHYAADVSLPKPGLQRIYALMQCTPELSSVYCDFCLQANVRDYKDCCRTKTGGTIQRPPCFFRWDIHPFVDAFDNITIRSSRIPQTMSPLPPPPVGKKISRGSIIAIVVSSTLFMALLFLGFVSWKRRKQNKLRTDDDIISPQSLQFDFKTIEDATNSFARNNKVGEGGFGEVYKGTFPNGTEVAVKRLSRNSGQGTEEFKNEVMVVAKLQHRNLVRLLGFCLEGDEKILVYEFVPNKSLDYFLFDATKRWQLNWTRRHNIIGGIVRGILYLHQDSRLKIIHRDLKASNVLLDDDMNSKVADFGTARIFGMEQTRANTGKIAGTFGYMAPEYAMHGLFSMKSDVYSFGVLVLEIVSGQRNSSFYQTDGSAGNLITHAWRLWKKGLALELLDPTLREDYKSDQVSRCIHIALLCVQKDPEDRPMMSTIILLLTSSTITLQVPRPPGFLLQSSRDQEPEAEGSYLFGGRVASSINDVTITELDPR